MNRLQSIAVSACLLGHKVRYDGAHQAHANLGNLLKGFDIIPVCPEVEIGLGVPRDKIALHQCGDNIRLLMSDESRTDLTERMVAYAQGFFSKHVISGMILKDKSPSCGVSNCRQYDSMGEMQRNGTGIFAATSMRINPDLPMLQSDQLALADEWDCFLRKVMEYDN